MTRCFEGCWSSTSQLATKRNSDDNSGLVGCVMREIKGTGAWGARYKCATSSLATRSRLETRSTAAYHTLRVSAVEGSDGSNVAPVVVPDVTATNEVAVNGSTVASAMLSFGGGLTAAKSRVHRRKVRQFVRITQYTGDGVNCMTLGLKHGKLFSQKATPVCSEEGRAVACEEATGVP